VVGDVQRLGGQWRMAVCPPACVRGSRVTGLGLHARVMGPRCTVAATWALDRWSLRRLGVRTWPGYSEPTWRARGRRCAREHRLRQTVSFNHLCTGFSPIFETEVVQTLNTKVARQVTLYKNAKGSRGFYSLV
jgi:hypothetical protein